MTVASTQAYVEYDGDGSTKSFTVPFYFILNSHIAVDIADNYGNVTTLLNGSDFSVSGEGDSSGGTVTMNNAYSSSHIIVIYRNPPITQEAKYYENGKFPAKSHEKALDKLTMLIQKFGWALDSLALKKPNFFSRYYDAKRNRIANLHDPEQDHDAATRNYVERMVAGVVGGFGWFIQSGAGAVYRTFQDKMRDVLTPSDFDNSSDAIDSALTNGKWLSNSTQTFTLTVGSGGQFDSLIDAIDAACKIRPTYANGNDYCVIELMSGFVLNEQMEFKGGVDLSWIKITSVDTIVYADTSAFSVSVTTYYSYKYLFYFHQMVKSPVFAIQIEENRSDSDVCAFVVTEESKLSLAPYSGARKFYVGVHATYGAKINGLHNGFAPGSSSVPDGYYLCDFSYSLKTALEAFVNVNVNLPLSKFEYNQDSTANPAVFAVYSCTLNFFASSVSYSNYTGWAIRDGCSANLRYHKSIQCKNIGLHCIHGVFIDARCHHTDETSSTTSGKVLDSSQQLGFYGCTLGIRMESAGAVEAAGTDFRSCTQAIQIVGSANFSAKACDWSDCGLVAELVAGATVSMPRFYATGIGKLCILSEGSNLAIWNLNVTRNTTSTETRFIDARYSSDVSIYNCIQLDSSIGLVATDNSRLSISGGTLKVPAVRSFEGAHVTLSSLTYDITYRTDSVKQLIISQGGTISAMTCTNSDASSLTTSTTKNTLSSAGAGYILCP